VGVEFVGVRPSARDPDAEQEVVALQVVSGDG
jgi:hypothetical protein